jgi:hypothetical protein
MKQQDEGLYQHVLWNGLVRWGLGYGTAVTVGLVISPLGRTDSSDILRYWALSVVACAIVGSLLSAIEWRTRPPIHPVPEINHSEPGTLLNLTLKWAKEDAVSAYRLRFLHSPALRIATGLGILGTVGLAAELVFACLQDVNIEPLLWFVPVIVALISVGTPAIVYLAAPSISFRRNLAWRQEYWLHLSEDTLTITLSGATQGCCMQWSRVKQVLEDERVYILVYGSGKADYVAIPKQVFQNNEQEVLFRNILRRKASPKWKSKAPRE